MNTNRRWVWTLLSLTAFIGSLYLPARAGQMAVVKGDRLNVRGQAKLTSEVVTQLRKGETVEVLEQITLSTPKADEPAVWARIAIPANTPVWVFAPYIEPATRTVNVRTLNLRAGPGENYSVLGKLTRGDVVREIQVTNGWMEIEAPDTASAFVAMKYLEVTGEAGIETTVGATNTIDTTTPIASLTTDTNQVTEVDITETEVEEVDVTDEAGPMETERIEPEEPLITLEEVATDGTNVLAAEIVSPDQMLLIGEIEEEPEPLPERKVMREGRVIYSRSIQAPTHFSLESVETGRTMNFLHSERTHVKLKNFAGRVVIVSGEEVMDERWKRTPILEVEKIMLIQ